jgi:NAD(P)H-dependent FMN reductase
VVGIAGSLRDGSYTRMAVACALQGAGALGAETRLVDLRDYALPFAGGRTDDDPPEGVRRLREDVRWAQGIVLGTPDYHSGVSGVLKNALDLMGFEEFQSKMVRLVGVSGGRMGAFDALNSLRSVGRALHAWVIPEQASVPEAWRVFVEDGTVEDAEVAERLRDVGRQVARFAFLHTNDRMREFLRMWEDSMPNPGGAGR